MIAHPDDPAEGTEDPLAEIEAATERFEVPEGFDPLRDGQVDLTRFGLPPRPDRDAQRELFDFWEELFSAPVTFQRAEFELALPESLHGRGYGTGGSGTHHEASLNWSGAYILPSDGRMLTQVLGSWRVPTILAPTGKPTGALYGSSTWIGFDGQREYFDSTLPQIGTGQFLNLPGEPGSTTKSWIQWWPRPAVTLDMLVVPGDLMLCWLIVVSQERVLFIIKNQSRGPLYWFIWRAPIVSKPPRYPMPARARVSGGTAEWVMERPAFGTPPVLFDLPDYSPVQFSSCLAVSSAIPGWTGQLERLGSPRLIGMYAIDPLPHRAVTVSVARRSGVNSVGTSYLY